MADSREFIDDLVLIAQFNQAKATMVMEGRNAVIVNSTIGAKHKVKMELISHTKRYGRIVFNPLSLVTIIKNVGKKRVAIHYRLTG